MAAFPTYINIDMGAFQIQPDPNAVIRSEFETGPAKQSEITSRQMERFSIVGYIFTNANFQAFQLWYRTTINHGADWFDWNDPITDTTVQGRIYGGRVRIKHLEDWEKWRIEFDLEVWEP